MSKYPFVPLGEVCDFIRGVSFDGNEAIEMPKEGYIPILRAGNIGDELYIHDDLVWVPEKRVAEEQYSQIGDIAICMASGSPAVLGKTAQLKEDFVGSVGAFCGIIRPTKADANYIAYWLKSPTFMAWRDAQANGVNIQNLRPNEVREIEIPLPPLAEQKRIASLLARADRLRQLRRAANALADSLLQSVFLEMFGDPSTNPKGWDVFELGEIVEINPSGRPKAKTEQPTSFLPMTLVDPSHIYSDTLDVKRFEDVSTGYTYFEENDVLFAKITPCMENGNIVIAKNLLNGFGFGSTEFHVIRPNEKANSAWLYAFVKRPEFRKEATRWFRGTAGQQRVPSDFLESYRVPLPPLTLQEEFARVAARVEGLRARMAESERQAQNLFESLLAQSFGG